MYAGYGEQPWEWGVPQRNYQLEVSLLSEVGNDQWGDGIKVVVKNADTKDVLAQKVFKDCETQNSDAQRWLNDAIGYPNPFATILMNEEWR